MKFFEWIAKTFEDGKGIPSSKRITSFWVTGIFTLTSWAQVIFIWKLLSGIYPSTDKVILLLDTLFKLDILLVSFISILLGVATLEGITNLIRGNKSNVIINSEKTVETKETETKTTPQ